MMPAGRHSLAFDVAGADWPNRRHSRFVTAGGLRWHIQEIGRGPPLLLLHGTGAAGHSFRDLAPRLAADFQVLVPDLPGHGFTEMPSAARGLSLRGMAELLAALLVRLDLEPAIVVGHSAGAAILIEMACRGPMAARAIVAINGALRPIPGAAWFSPLAKLLFLNPLVPRLFALRAADRDATRRLLERTGSHIDARGIDLYARLFRNSGHVSAALGMMANWDLGQLDEKLARLPIPLTLITTADDRAVAPADAVSIAAAVEGVRLIALPDGGHLVHEEQPGRIAGLILDIANAAGCWASRNTVKVG